MFACKLRQLFKTLKLIVFNDAFYAVTLRAKAELSVKYTERFSNLNYLDFSIFDALCGVGYKWAILSLEFC
jgi:hypothetical protein